MIDQLTLEDFEKLQDRDLQLRFGAEEQTGRIIEVRAAAGGAPGGRKPFSIILRSGSRDRYWPQGIQTLVHPDHGELSLFMVPIGPDDQGMRYEISFA